MEEVMARELPCPDNLKHCTVAVTCSCNRTEDNKEDMAAISMHACSGPALAATYESSDSDSNGCQVGHPWVCTLPAKAQEAAANQQHSFA